MSIFSRSSRSLGDSRSGIHVPPWQALHHTESNQHIPSTSSYAHIYKAWQPGMEEEHELQATLRDNLERDMASSKAFRDGDRHV